MSTTPDTPDWIRARAIAEVRIPCILRALYVAREHLAQTPVVYDVEGQCLYQAADAVRDAIRKLERIAETHDIATPVSRLGPGMLARMKRRDELDYDPLPPARAVSVRTDHKGERIWYDPSRRCLTVIRQASPTHWVFVREATAQDKALPYYGD